MNIVICGYPRSGSTMFYDMLRTTVRGWRFADREISALRVEGDGWITKYPSDAFFADEIERKRGPVRFVATIRDPRSVLCSRHYTTGDIYKVSWDRVVFGRRDRLQGRRKRIRRHPSGHMQHDKGFLDWDRAVRALPDPVVVRYEDLVRDPDGEQERIVDALGLVTEGRFADFHERDLPERLTYQLNGLRPVERGRIESWRDHPERIREQFTACPALFEVVRYWGYEHDDRWFPVRAA